MLQTSHFSLKAHLVLFSLCCIITLVCSYTMGCLQYLNIQYCVQIMNYFSHTLMCVFCVQAQTCSS